MAEQPPDFPSFYPNPIPDKELASRTTPELNPVTLSQKPICPRRPLASPRSDFLLSRVVSSHTRPECLPAPPSRLECESYSASPLRLSLGIDRATDFASYYLAPTSSIPALALAHFRHTLCYSRARHTLCNTLCSRSLSVLFCKSAPNLPDNLSGNPLPHTRYSPTKNPKPWIWCLFSWTYYR